MGLAEDVVSALGALSPVTGPFQGFAGLFGTSGSAAASQMVGGSAITPVASGVGSIPQRIRSRLVTQVARVYENGAIEVEDTERGRPKLMTGDAAAARRYFRIISKAYRKLPKRTVVRRKRR